MSFLLEAMFPKKCMGCGRSGAYICDLCRKQVVPIEYSICPVCCKSAIGGKTHPRCQKPFGPDGLISVYHYSGIMREMVRQLKYAPYITDSLAELMSLLATSLQSHETFLQFIQQKPVIVPVPLYWMKRLQRGFNQTELLAKVIGDYYQLSCVSLLNRKQHTKPQFGLHRTERMENVVHAFVMREGVGKIDNPNVLIVDDVWTTGSTMRACCKVLKRYGVSHVWAFTIAR